ncbi:TPA: hypothetical protein QDB14_004509 [Burkholderia vietnamiensis]|nr:hypothetical protein [Burkholderia vietnamiensis]
MTTEQKSNPALAREARERGERTFTAHCTKHGTTERRAGNARCILCEAEANARSYAKSRQDPEFRQANRERVRTYQAARKATDPAWVAKERARKVNLKALQRLRDYGRPETAVPNKETLAECLEFVKRVPSGCVLDHGVPLKGFHPVTGEWVVSGLHVAWNLEPMTARSNQLKHAFFDPMAPLEFQKPYNSYPGGQFHGDIGEIEFMRYQESLPLELMTLAEFDATIIEQGNADMDAQVA